MPDPRVIDRFSLLASDYNLVLSDVWGVVHNGVVSYPDAGRALERFRAGGGTVVMVSNSPRPGLPVRKQLDHFGVIRTAYDDVVTSGDVTRGLLEQRPGGLSHRAAARSSDLRRPRHPLHHARGGRLRRLLRPVRRRQRDRRGLPRPA